MARSGRPGGAQTGLPPGLVDTQLSPSKAGNEGVFSVKAQIEIQVSKPTKRQKFTREYKLEAVRLSSEGTKSVATVAAEFGIDPHQLYRWRRAFERDGMAAFSANGSSPTATSLPATTSCTTCRRRT
jgi:transposase-like protein